MLNKPIGFIFIVLLCLQANTNINTVKPFFDDFCYIPLNWHIWYFTCIGLKDKNIPSEKSTSIIDKEINLSNLASDVEKGISLLEWLPFFLLNSAIRSSSEKYERHNIHFGRESSFDLLNKIPQRK
jgi:hypothetical protein